MSIPSYLRHKIIHKLAQETSAQKPISSSPPSFAATNFFPSIILGLTSKNSSIVDQISKILNDAIFYASDGYTSLDRLKDQNFSFPADQSQKDLKSLIQFAGQLHSSLFTDRGKNFTTTLKSEEIQSRANSLFNSTSLGNLSQVNPSSQLAAKIGTTNLKGLFQNFLLQLK